MLYFVIITFSCQNIYEIALFKVSSLVEHIVENYWSKFDANECTIRVVVHGTK